MVRNTTLKQRNNGQVVKPILLLSAILAGFWMVACDSNTLGKFGKNNPGSPVSQNSPSEAANPQPASKSSQVQEADAAFDAEDYEKAAKLYQAAIDAGKAKGSDLVYLYTSLGLSYDKLDRFDEAIVAYRKALDIDPKAHEVWVNLGVVYRLKGDYDQAIAHYQKALDINPKYAEAHSSLGTLYLLQGDAQAAIDKFETAIKLNPNLAVAHGNLALAYATANRFEDADASLRQSIVLGYKNADVIRERIDQLKKK